MDLKKLALRTCSGAVYVVIVTGLICCGYLGVLLLSAIFTILATLEFDRISATPQKKKLSIVACDVLLNLSLALSPGPQILVALSIFLILLFIRYVLELSLNEEHPLRSLSTSIMTVIYIGFPMMCMSLLGLLEVWHDASVTNSAPFWLIIHPAWPILAIFVFIWINDTGAFLTGSMIGRHKMSVISPKKTWEGFWGGMFFTVIASILAGVVIFATLNIPIWVWLVYGILVSLFATWGDLTESLIKRNLGLKDSGNLIPGHGGILDRIDSLLFVMPMTVMIVLILLYFSSCLSIPSAW